MELVEATTAVDDVDAFVDRLGTIGDEYGVAVQAFDARYVVGRDHLERAVALADRAIGRDEAIANDRAIEILLYAAGRRQIDRALAMGVSESGDDDRSDGDGDGNGCPAVILVDSPDGDAEREAAAAAAVRDLPEIEPADLLGAYDPDRVRGFFGITDAELAASDGDLPSLVRERVALLSVEK